MIQIRFIRGAMIAHLHRRALPERYRWRELWPANGGLTNKTENSTNDSGINGV
jgi:hypothetical protein